LRLLASNDLRLRTSNDLRLWASNDLRLRASNNLLLLTPNNLLLCSYWHGLLMLMLTPHRLLLGVDNLLLLNDLLLLWLRHGCDVGLWLGGEARHSLRNLVRLIGSSLEGKVPRGGSVARVYWRGGRNVSLSLRVGEGLNVRNCLLGAHVRLLGPARHRHVLLSVSNLVALSAGDVLGLAGWHVSLLRVDSHGEMSWLVRLDALDGMLRLYESVLAVAA
jgi:hypothetical protein